MGLQAPCLPAVSIARQVLQLLADLHGQGPSTARLIEGYALDAVQGHTGATHLMSDLFHSDCRDLFVTL